MSLRLWECNIEDDGMAKVCEFLLINNTIETLDFLKNKLTDVGCECLGRVLGPTSQVPLKILHLDHNPIGSKGVEGLAIGLSQNKFLNVLTLSFDNLDATCAPAICRILIYIESNIKEVELIGNQLKGEGVAGILPAMKIAKSLISLDVSDNQVEDNPKFQAVLSDLAVNSRNFQKLNLGNNFISNEFIKQVMQSLEEGKKIIDINFGIKIDNESRLKLKSVLTENKKVAKKAKKKKKKGKKGKKGKKKKK